MTTIKMYCPRCEKEQEIILSPSGPHIKASCNICGAYIKFIGKKELEKP